jgi:hypothetical protein
METIKILLIRIYKKRELEWLDGALRIVCKDVKSQLILVVSKTRPQGFKCHDRIEKVLSRTQKPWKMSTVKCNNCQTGFLKDLEALTWTRCIFLISRRSEYLALRFLEWFDE